MWAQSKHEKKCVEDGSQPPFTNFFLMELFRRKSFTSQYQSNTLGNVMRPFHWDGAEWNTIFKLEATCILDIDSPVQYNICFSVKGNKYIKIAIT